jgi:stage II sporulation protein D
LRIGIWRIVETRDTLARLMRRLLLLSAVALCLPAPASAGTVFLIDGRGWGHGIGMSQYGARGFAEAGWGHQRILAHYYRGTQLRVVPARPVRVLLAEGRPAVRIGSTKPFRVVDARGKVRKLKPGPQRVVAVKIAQLRFPLRYLPGAAPLTLDGDAFRGTLIVHRDARKLTVVNKLPLDRYLRGVVPWEMPDDWHPEALRAQSVVARSYALATLKPGTRFDLYADTRSQVYGGIAAEAASTNRAIGSTAGRVLVWNGRVATTFYHSTSGGRTAAVAEVWPRAKSVPYLVSVPDPHDSLSKHHRWGPVRLTPSQVGKRLGLGAVRDLVPTRGPSGRVSRMKLKLRSGTRTMLSQDFRRSLDLRSTWFSVRVLHLEAASGRALARAGRPTTLRGFVRGLGKVRLEQQVNGGTWKTLKRVRLRPDGRFTVSVSPRRTTSYRLATPSAAGGAVTVKTR